MSRGHHAGRAGFCTKRDRGGWKGRKRREVRTSGAVRARRRSKPLLYFDSCHSRQGLSTVLTEAEFYRLDHNSASPPGGPSAWYAPAVRVERRLCDSGAAILRGSWCLRSSTPRSLRAEPQALPLPPARSCRRPPGRPGTAWAKRGSPQPFHHSSRPSRSSFDAAPGSLYARRPPP